MEEIVTRHLSVFVALCKANEGRLRAVQPWNKWFTAAESSEFTSIIQFKHLIKLIDTLKQLCINQGGEEEIEGKNSRQRNWEGIDLHLAFSSSRPRVSRTRPTMRLLKCRPLEVPPKEL